MWSLDPSKPARLLRAAMIATATWAASVGPALATATPQDAVRTALKKLLPDAPVDSVQRTPYGGLYEVTIGADIYYVDEKASFVLPGPLIELATRTNVTELRQRELLRIDFASLPLDQAFRIVRGTGARKVAMFSDPNCPYCKRLERDLLGVTDITIYLFLYPILSPDSMQKSRQVWCAADAGRAWIDWMVRDVPLQGDGRCIEAGKNAVEANLAFGSRNRVTGTPTLFFEDGDRIPGAIPVAEVEKKLAAAALAKHKTR
jgi:thiol:disulfide interchange protein DsbC